MYTVNADQRDRGRRGDQRHTFHDDEAETDPPDGPRDGGSLRIEGQLGRLVASPLLRAKEVVLTKIQAMTSKILKDNYFSKRTITQPKAGDDHLTRSPAVTVQRKPIIFILSGFVRSSRI